MSKIHARLVRLEQRQGPSAACPSVEPVQPEEVVEVFRRLADQGNAEARQVITTLDAATGGKP